MVGCQTCDWKLIGLILGSRIVFFRVTSCADSFLYPFHYFFAAVASKIPQSFCQNCRLWVAATHVYTLDLVKSEGSDCAAQAVWEPIRETNLHISGNTRPVISAYCAAMDCSLAVSKCGIGMHRLIYTLKRPPTPPPPPKCRWEIICGSLPILAWEEKATTTST